MGQLNCVSCHKGKLIDVEEADFQKCLPETRYRRFPSSLKKPSFSLLLENFVFPAQDYHKYLENQQSGYGSRINSSFWWSDALFAPNDDSVLFVIGEPFGQRPLEREESAKPLTATGTVLKLKLDGDSCDEEIFSKTGSTVYPKLSMHPSGSYIGFADDRALEITTIQHNEEQINARVDPTGRCLTECLSIAFAPDGKKVAQVLLRYLDDRRLNTLGFYIEKFELVVSLIDNGFLSFYKAVNLDEKVPRFYSSTMQDDQDYIEYMMCKWSPDSDYIAVCSPRSLCILNRKLKLSVNVVSEILKFEVFETSGYTFDFDPRSYHELLAVGTNDRYVYFVNSASKKVLKRSNALESKIEYLQYNPSGKYVAVGTQNYSIYLVETSEGAVLHCLDMHAQCPDIQDRYYISHTFTRLSFTTTGEQLVVATSDAKVRVFQMPGDFSLFDFCKWTIMTQVPQTKLKYLPLPKKLISKLLAVPVMR